MLEIRSSMLEQDMQSISIEGRSSEESKTRQLAVCLVKKKSRPEKAWNDELVKRHSCIICSLALEFKPFIILERDLQLISTKRIHRNNLWN